MLSTISAEVHQRLLQKIAVLEMGLHQLRLDMEVNTQSNGQEPATQHWNTLGAKPKAMTGQITGTRSPEVTDKTGWPALPSRHAGSSTPVQQWTTTASARRITGRTRSPKVTDKTGWPALPSRHAASSTPVHQWKTAKGRTTNKPPQKISVQLRNRFTPLLHDRPDDTDNVSSPSRVRTQDKSPHRQQMPEILIVGDTAVKDVKNIIKRKAKVLCFPKDTLSDMNDRILDVVAAHPTVKSLILHIGTCDTEQKQSEILKQRFMTLFSTLNSLDVDLCISGPLPPTRGSDEKFSRLSGLSKWLSTTCANESVHFIDNFNFFWYRRHLFAPDGLQLNKRGIKLFISNMFHSLCARNSKGRTERYITIDNAEMTASPALPLTSDGGGEASAPTEEDGGAVLKTSEPTDSGATTPISGPKTTQVTAEIAPQEEIAKVPPSSLAVEEETVLKTTQPTADNTTEESFQDVSLTPSHPSSSLDMSPIQLLEFTNGMNDLVSMGTRLTPLKRQAPHPPTLEALSPPRSPPPRPPPLQDA